MSRFIRPLFSAFLALALLGLGGCSWFKASPTTLNVAIDGSAQLNLNSEQQPSPVVIRFYQLASADKFLAADFFALHDHDTVTLGGDLITSKEFELRPRETLTYEDKKLPDSVHFLGVVADFRDVANATWRASVPIVMSSDNKYVATADLSTITLKPPESRSWWKIF